jgi:hypothetical protein
MSVTSVLSLTMSQASSPSALVTFRRPMPVSTLRRSLMTCCMDSNAAAASGSDGPTNSSAQFRHGQSSTSLPSIKMSLQSRDSAPCPVIRLTIEDLPDPGSPPMTIPGRSLKSTRT